MHIHIRMCSHSGNDLNTKPKGNINFAIQLILKEHHFRLNRIILLAKDALYFC